MNYKYFLASLLLITASQTSFAEGIQQISCAFIQPKCVDMNPLAGGEDHMNIHYTTNDRVYFHGQLSRHGQTSTFKISLLDEKSTRYNASEFEVADDEITDRRIYNFETASGVTYGVRCVAKRTSKNTSEALPSVCSLPPL